MRTVTVEKYFVTFPLEGISSEEVHLRFNAEGWSEELALAPEELMVMKMICVIPAGHALLRKVAQAGFRVRGKAQERAGVAG